MIVYGILIMIFSIVIELGFPIVLIAIFISIKNKFKKNYVNVNEWSYQRYADFYGKMELSDSNFNEKIYKIKELILNKKCTDIKIIADESGCTVEECILKINYLQNKRILENYCVDDLYLKVFKCSEEDLRLYNKYKPYIYRQHATIEEMVNNMPGFSLPLELKKENIIKEIKYLIDKNIINGVKYNEIDEKLIYYTVEKHTKEKDMCTISCPNCGALNDVDYNNKVRCKYCKTIIQAPKTLKEIKRQQF